MVAVAVTAVTDPIRTDSAATVVASGTTDAGTNTVAVSIVDSEGTKVGPIAATVAGTAWSIAATDVTSLADGTLIFEATATDLAAAKAFGAKAAHKITSASFVTVARYAAARQLTIVAGSALETAVNMALAAACATIRGYLGQQVDAVAGDVIVLDGSGRRGLILPEMPVNAVNAVTIDKGLATELVVTDFVALFGGVLARTGLQDAPSWDWRCGSRPRRAWPLGIANITVDYDHGYAADAIPPDMEMIAIQAARAAISAPNPGLTGETIGGYAYTVDPAVAANAVLSFSKTLDNYKLPRVMVA